MTLRRSLPGSLARSLPGSLAPADLIWDDMGGGSPLAWQLVKAAATALGASLYLDYRTGFTPDVGAGCSWQPVIGATAFTHVTGAAAPTLAADGVSFARSLSQFLTGGNLSTYVTASAGTLIAITKLNASDANGAPENTNNPAIIMTQGSQNCGLTHRSAPDLQLTTIDAQGAPVAKVIEATSINGTLQCVEASWFTDNFLRLRVAGADAVAKAFTSPLGSLVSASRVGVNTVAGDFIDGKIQAIIAFPSQVISTSFRTTLSQAFQGIAT